MGLINSCRSPGVLLIVLQITQRRLNDFLKLVAANRMFYLKINVCIRITQPVCQFKVGYHAQYRVREDFHFWLKRLEHFSPLAVLIFSFPPFPCITTLVNSPSH